MDQLGLNLTAPANSGDPAAQNLHGLGSMHQGETPGQNGMTANALAGLTGMGFTQGLNGNPANNLLGQLGGIPGIPGLGNPAAGL